MRLAAAVACLIVAGCATSTAPTRGPNIASDLRPAARSTEADLVSQALRAQQVFLRGMTQARLGRHDEALDLYAQALQLAPRTAAILAAAAESHSARGDESAALYSLRRARAADPQNPFYSLQLAELHLSMGDRASAARVYGEVLELTPHNVDALYELARVYTMNGELSRAASTYERLLGEIGFDREIENQLLHLYARLEDAEGMERILTEMLEHQPHDPQLRRMLADLYVKQERSQDAVDELVEALQMNPGDVPTLLSLAELYRTLGRSDEAEKLMNQAADVDAMNPSQLLARAEPLFARAQTDGDAREAVEPILERVLELDPQNEQALLMLGDLRLGREEYEGAGELLYRALEKRPRDPQLWMQAASAFLQAGRLQRAAEIADEGLMLFPGSLSLLQIGGYALMDTYKNAEAARHFEQAVRIIREDESEGATGLAELYSALGLLYSRMNDPERSDRSYEQAIEAEPDNAAALNNFAYNLAARDADLDRARDMAERAVELDPNVPAYLDTLGWVLYRMGAFEESLQYIRRAANQPGASAAVFEHLGDAYHALGDAPRAVDAWNRALEMNPDNAFLIEKLDRQ